MDIVVKRCTGLDVHKKQVVACVLILESATGELRKEVRTFDTNTRGLRALGSWLRAERVTHAAMESTGEYWKPVYNVLQQETACQLLLANARHIKQVPGRKTDVKDCEWIARLLQHGLLQASFVPSREIREQRDLTRHRASLAEDKTRVANRIQKVLEDANIKLASVATDCLGASGRLMLRAMINGETDPERLADLAQRMLRKKLPELRAALDGAVTDHHRFMLSIELDQLEKLEQLIDRIDARLEEITRPFELQLRLLDTIPGVALRTAQNILAEIGANMGQFPSAKHLASWAGICPGNCESAGKRLSGKTSKGNRWCRRALTEAAWAASRTKKGYLPAQFRRLAHKRGRKRAILAVAHSILVAAYYMLRDNVGWNDLGSDFFDRRNADNVRQYHVRRLKELGYTVELKAA